MPLHARQQLFIVLVALLTSLGGGLLGQHHSEGWALFATGILLAGMALLPLLRHLRRPRPVSFAQLASQTQEKQG